MAKKATTDDKIMKLVERELEKKPDSSVDELMEKAAKVDKSVSDLTKRQFNARYPLQIKRRKGGSKKKRSTRKKKTTTRRSTKSKAKAKPKGKSKPKADESATSAVDREAVRATFMEFASAMASAEARRDLVKFLAGVDRYVDKVIKAANK